MASVLSVLKRFVLVVGSASSFSNMVAANGEASSLEDITSSFNLLGSTLLSLDSGLQGAIDDSYIMSSNATFAQLADTASFQQ